MRALLDTHVFVWWVLDDPRLSPTPRRLLRDVSNAFLLSVASAWELAIKKSVGRLHEIEDFGKTLPEELQINGFDLLPIDLRHVIATLALPNHHKDPFDRILVAQAKVENLPILTADPAIARYDVERIW